MKIEHLPLLDMITYPSWTDAPVGRIIQVTVASKEGETFPLLAMRCEFPKLPLSALAWIVVLEGADIGVLLSSEDIARSPAVDLTDCVEDIGVAEPLPTKLDYKASRRGMVLKSGGFFLDAEAPSGVKGYVPLIVEHEEAAGRIVDAIPFPALVLGRPSVRLRDRA